MMNTHLCFGPFFIKNFRGKGLNFMRGYLGGKGIDSNKASECVFNFIVPNENTLNDVCKEFSLDIKEPGIIESTLNLFSESNPGAFVKLCFDCKKLKHGIGEGAEENLCGHEQSPTLIERKARLKEERESI